MLFCQPYIQPRMNSVSLFQPGLQINSLPCAAGRLIAVALVSVVVGSFVVTAKVFAQGGSTGGTIGKIDKSQSGADAAPSVQPESKASKPAKRAGAHRNIATSSCSKMPGNWSWFNFNNVVISPDGTATAGPFSATWSCKDDSVVMHWSHGYTDRLTLSRNGTHLEGTNGSVTVTGDRK
jgi:hypothetical protein